MTRDLDVTVITVSGRPGPHPCEMTNWTRSARCGLPAPLSSLPEDPLLGTSMFLRHTTLKPVGWWHRSGLYVLKGKGESHVSPFQSEAGVTRLSEEGRSVGGQEGGKLSLFSQEPSCESQGRGSKGEVLPGA